MVATFDCTVLMKDACDVLLEPVEKVRRKATDAAYVELVLDPDEAVLVLGPDEGVDCEPVDVELVPSPSPPLSPLPLLPPLPLQLLASQVWLREAEGQAAPPY